MATTGKIAEVMFEEALEEYEHQEMIIDKVDFFEPDAATMQNANNVVWRPTQHHAPILTGWDMTGQEQEIIEQTYPSQLGQPKNDFVQQRADDLRDITFWKRRGKQSGMQQATELNKSIANVIATQGTMYYRDDSASGYDYIAQGQAIMNERQGMMTDRCYLLNDRDTLKFSRDLAGRQTVQGRPEDAWSMGQIGSNVAEFDVYTGSFLPNLVGGVNPNTTVTGNQTFKPEGGSVNTLTGVVTNVDYRIATIPVAASAAYNVGDKVKFTNPGTGDVNAVGLADKTNTGQAMTFTIVDRPTATSVQIYPKPIAADDTALTVTERAYANVDTTILNAANMVRLNITTAKTNLFWDKDAIEVIGGNIPAELFKQFDGFQVIHSTMKNGQEMYMIYDGNIATMNFRYRLFTWYGITARDPSRMGVSQTF